MRHSDECRQRITEAVEADDEGKMRTFLDKNAARRPGPAPKIAGGGGAAPAVAAPTMRAVGGASSSNGAGGARPSPMEAEHEESKQHKRRQSSSSAPAAAHVLEQRQAKRVRFESRGEPSQDGRMRISTKRASETDAEELEPEISERPRRSSGVE